MINIWTWVISGSAGFLGGLLGGAFKWFVPSFSDLKDGWHVKAEKKLEASIMELLGDGQIWNSASLAKEMEVDQERVIDSLQSLELRGRVRSDSGSSDDPGRIYWLNRL